MTDVLAPSARSRTPEGAQPSRRIDDWAELVREEAAAGVSLRAPLTIGIATLVLGVGGFVAWAATTPIAAASIAPGRVVVDGRVKTVTHLEGGTLAALKVAEGDRVAAGQVLMTLDVTRSEARLAQLDDYAFGLSVRLARLHAEREDRTSVDFPGEAAVAGETPEAAAPRRAVVDAERRVFATRRTTRREAADLERAMLAQIAARSEGLTGELAALKAQAAIVGDEMRTLEALYAKGLAVRSRVAEVRLMHARTMAEIGSAESGLVALERQADEARLQRAAVDAAFGREVEAAIQETQLALAQARHERITAGDIVAKAEIRAPAAGTVTGIRLTTPGSALIAGHPLMDIVPDDRPLMVEARVRPQDIDTVAVGMPAEIRLTAYSQTATVPLAAEVTYVAADTTHDERSGESYYVLRANVPPQALAAQPHLTLHPGMTAEVMIVGKSRTAWEYLTTPFRESLGRAMREE